MASIGIITDNHSNEFTTEDRREWFYGHNKDKFPLLVAEKENLVLGWINLCPYRKGREALEKTAELGCFVHNDHKQKGIANKLLIEMLSRAKEIAYKTILAIILDKNIGSAKLLEKNSFEKWGFLTEVAEIDGNKMSHIYYGRKL
jgi:L-amino acid N-acyltransferase